MRLWTPTCLQGSVQGTVNAAPTGLLPQWVSHSPVGHQGGHDGAADTEAQGGKLLSEPS